MFRKVLIANRGEIAVRVVRACHEMGIAAVAVYSDADRDSLHVPFADYAYRIGPAPSRESYLCVDKILAVARQAGCDAVHPGYGFLAENADFAEACADMGLVFIGPSPLAMRKLGSKTAARRVASDAGVPTVPGTLDPIEDLARARSLASEIGFPLLLKAVAGGGGKGMRAIARESDLEGGWRDAQAEAANAFGDGRLYVEKLLRDPRHIEMQILGDWEGRLVHLGERECSVQRRHQKVLEEAPSPVVDRALREAMGEAALRVARAGGYHNAGTVEFLVDAERRFYFLEVNTRLQVEHPVTEAVTSLDLVKLQIRIAAGERLPLRQEDVAVRGHAIECRIYAEDPENHFFPSPGKILALRLPEGPGIRNDVGVAALWTVPPDYDPILGKLIAWGADREEARARLGRALEEYAVVGIKTNLGMFRRLVRDPEFARAAAHTAWLDDWLRRSGTSSPSPSPAAPEEENAAALVAALWATASAVPRASAPVAPSPWKLQGRADELDNQPRRGR